MKRTILILLIILSIFILNKSYILSSNKLTPKQEKEFNKIAENILIKDLKVTNKKDVDEYIEYKNLKIEKLDNYECSESGKLTCTNEDKEITISKEKTYLEIYKEEYNKNTKIESDLDLLGWIKEASLRKNNIITYASTMREDYKAKLFAIDNLEEILSIDLIAGDIEGFMYHNDSKTRTFFYKDYRITFKNIIDEDILEIINTIK